MDTYKVLTARTPNELEAELNKPAYQEYEIASVTGSFELIYQGGGPDTGITVILKRTQASLVKSAWQGTRTGETA